jgi:hypothetical protein
MIGYIKLSFSVKKATMLAIRMDEKLCSQKEKRRKKYG